MFKIIRSDQVLARWLYCTDDVLVGVGDGGSWVQRIFEAVQAIQARQMPLSDQDGFEMPELERLKAEGLHDKQHRAFF
jgi:hypothetical protein